MAQFALQDFITLWVQANDFFIWEISSFCSNLYLQETGHHREIDHLVIPEQWLDFWAFQFPIFQYAIWSVKFINNLYFYHFYSQASALKVSSNDHCQWTRCNRTMSISRLFEVTNVEPFIVLVFGNYWSTVICWAISCIATNDVYTFFGRSCCIVRNP